MDFTQAARLAVAIAASNSSSSSCTAAIFEEEVATIKATHSKEALAQLKIEITSRSLPQMWDEFSKFLTTVRSISMTTAQSSLALKTVLHLPDPKSDDKPARKEALEALDADFSARLCGYRQELGENTLTPSRLTLVSPFGQRAAVCLVSRHSPRLAVFNTLTDIAARPPERPCFQQTRDTIERRSGRWLKELARQSLAIGFNLEAWISAWETGGTGRQISGRN